MRLFLQSILFLGLCVLLFGGCRKKNTEVLPEGEVILPRDMAITDAEYSKKKDILVYVSTNPSQLNILNPAQNSTEKVMLDYAPMSVSLSSDGNFAVVGFDAHLSYIDLNTRKVISTYDVGCEALDIVLGDNKWAYVFPKRDQWASIHCIDLANGKETLSQYASIYAGSKGRLHPSGKYLYVTDNFLGPSDIEKFDVQQGTATLLYDSKYHGTYPVEGDLWFSEDGKRVFLKGQTVMKLADNQEEDMIYNGTIALDTITNTVNKMKRISSLDHSAITNRLFAISTDSLDKGRPNLPYIYVYNATNLDYLRNIPVKKGATGTPTLDPQFVFVNSKGDQLYVITKEQEGNSIKWAIQVL
ncbi:YncE family protein [Dyadobacter aurulentus]|uniref:YncE family protein n=1 Tax=Dyadobacter sp. UC 10 TaxID=2605428 RepID=UPI0011F319CF|nr:hypothetical protein [Dyadobacter sp. UC 10]KAA0991710.1 hypothetical protein FXO21_16790 [Dyadobacter sp. UC 10]